jgi:hypothetical protein
LGLQLNGNRPQAHLPALRTTAMDNDSQPHGLGGR